MRKPASSSFPADLQTVFPFDDLIGCLLEASLTGVALYTPIRGAKGKIVDFAIQLLNPAAQRILRQPARPGGTYLHHYPHTRETGVFAFHCEAFESGQPRRMDVNYQGDGLDNYFQLSARRVGQGLLVSFSDTGDQPRTPVEVALRESQARERAALAEAESQRAALYHTFMQAPAMICIFAGPEHVFELVNPLYQRLVGTRPLLGRPIRAAMPELAGQPIFGLLDEVYRSGKPFQANEMLVQLDHENAGVRDLQKRYYNFVYQPRRDTQGVIDGILVFAYEVTEQVLAQQQVGHSERLTAFANEELAAANEELQAANEEIRSANDTLFTTQLSLRELNQELEARVAERTTQAHAARAEAELQRARLERFFMQAPAAICILDGPKMVFELVNPAYQAMFAGRPQPGLPLLVALPELAGHSVWHTLCRVYETGITHREENMQVLVARPEDGALEERYFSYIQQARFDERGLIDGVLVFAFEVTEQVLTRQRAEALQAEVLAAAQSQAQEREMFYQIFEQTPAMVALLRGPEHRLAYFNEAYGQLFSGRLVRGQTLAESQPEAVAQGFGKLLDHVYQTGETFIGTELPLAVNQPDGLPPQTTYFNFSYQAYQENGQTAGISVFATDVTEQVRARQLLGLANQELSAANRAVGTRNDELAFTNQQLTRTNQDLDNFVYAASHDLKQPVNNLAGLFQELRQVTEFTDAEEQALLVPMIDAALHQLSSTIDDLAALGQVQRHPHLATEPVDLTELTQNVLQTLQPQVVAARARITTDFSARPTISYARANLRTVLLNLLSNALKYADPGRPGRVHLSLWLEAGRPVLLVEDNGLGFDLERHRDELFHLFRRFHSHTDGTGVGLYLVNRIVQSHGGRVEVESEVGVGTTFRLFL